MLSVYLLLERNIYGQLFGSFIYFTAKNPIQFICKKQMIFGPVDNHNPLKNNSFCGLAGSYMSWHMRYGYRFICLLGITECRAVGIKQHIRKSVCRMRDGAHEVTTANTFCRLFQTY